MITKKNLLLISGVVTAALFLSNWIGTFKLCGGIEYGQCMDITYAAIINFVPVIGVFVISLVTFWMSDQIYRTWFKFARWSVPLSMFLILITPEYGGGLFNPIQKGSVAFALTILFFVISLIIILIKFIRLRR
jgi:hypothetical protein